MSRSLRDLLTIVVGVAVACALAAWFGLLEWFVSRAHTLQRASLDEVFVAVAMATAILGIAWWGSRQMVGAHNGQGTAGEGPSREDVEVLVTKRTLELTNSVDELSREVQRRKRAEHALRESEKRFRLALRATGAAVYDWEIEEDTTWTSINHDELLGRRSKPRMAEWWVDKIHPTERAQIVASLRSALQDGSARWEGEYRFLLPDGHYADIGNQAYIVRDDAGQAIRVIGVVTNGTEAKRDKENTHRAERLASISTLAAGVAHELNSPLGSILLSAERAMKVEGMPDAAAMRRECFEDIGIAADRSARIVRSLVKFARQEPSEKWPNDLNRIVFAVKESSSRWVEGQRASLELDLESNLPQVSLCPIEIEEVLMNLIRNVVEAGGVGTSIQIRTRRDGNDHVRIEIEDDGPGLTESGLGRTLEPFHGDRVEAGGAELGPSLAHGVVLDHGGTIQLRRGAGRGAIMLISLPCAPASEGRLDGI